MGGVTTVVPPTVHQKVPYALACSSSQVLPHFCLVEGRKTEHNANRSDVLQMCKAVKSAPRCVLLHASLCSQVVRPSVCPSVCPFVLLLPNLWTWYLYIFIYDKCQKTGKNATYATQRTKKWCDATNLIRPKTKFLYRIFETGVSSWVATNEASGIFCTPFLQDCRGI